jgi:hypothetical protein
VGTVRTDVLDDPTTPKDRPEEDVGVDIPEVDVPEIDSAEGDPAMVDSAEDDPAMVDSAEDDPAMVDSAEGDPAIDVPDGSDAPAGLRASFWAVVLLFNIALLLISVGPMFALILGRWRIGGVLFAVGTIAFGFGVRRVRDLRDEFS